MPYCLLTNGVETTSIWFNTLRDETGRKVLREGMPLLLEMYARQDIRCTFFFTGYMARLCPDAVKMVANGGHEVPSHGKSHLPENGFDVMPFERQRRHLSETKILLEDLAGQEVISFRAPALRVGKDTSRALIEAGYKIDSSVASQRFDFFLSFGGVNKLQWLTAPRRPYRAAKDSLFQKRGGIGRGAFVCFYSAIRGHHPAYFSWFVGFTKAGVALGGQGVVYKKEIV